MPRPLRRIDTRRVVLEDRLHVRRSRLPRKTTAGLVVRLGRRLRGGRHSKMPQVISAYADGVTDRAGAPQVGRCLSGGAASMTRHGSIIDDSVESARPLIRPPVRATAAAKGCLDGEDVVVSAPRGTTWCSNTGG